MHFYLTFSLLFSPRQVVTRWKKISSLFTRDWYFARRLGEHWFVKVRLHTAINRTYFVDLNACYIRTKVTKCIREKTTLYFLWVNR